jgi:orotate phosphoribosyltransferase
LAPDQRVGMAFRKLYLNGEDGVDRALTIRPHSFSRCAVDLLPIRRGHFRFESGYHGEIWLDLDRLFAYPRRIAPLARELAGRLSGHDVEAVVGPLVGGAFLAQMIAAELEVEFAYAEPQPAAAGGLLYSVAYRLPNTVAPLLKDKRVVIVDDAINAGSPLRGTFHALVAAGAKPAVAGALIVFSDTACPFLTANGLVLEGLVTLPTPWPPKFARSARVGRRSIHLRSLDGTLPPAGFDESPCSSGRSCPDEIRVLVQPVWKHA